MKVIILTHLSYKLVLLLIVVFTESKKGEEILYYTILHQSFSFGTWTDLYPPFTLIWHVFFYFLLLCSLQHKHTSLFSKIHQSLIWIRTVKCLSAVFGILLDYSIIIPCHPCCVLYYTFQAQWMTFCGCCFCQWFGKCWYAINSEFNIYTPNKNKITN